MPPIDWALLINWLVTGFIGLFFGVIGGYITYRLERKRDDIKWAREKEQLELSWKHDREQLELVWQQKLQELEIHFLREEQSKLRQDLLKGLDNPRAIIEQIENQIRIQRQMDREVRLEMLKSLIDQGLMEYPIVEDLAKDLIQKLLDIPIEEKGLDSPTTNPQLSSSVDETTSKPKQS